MSCGGLREFINCESDFDKVVLKQQTTNIPVVGVGFGKSAANDELVCRVIEAFPALRSITIFEMGTITNAAFRRLPTLTELETLFFVGPTTQVNDETMEIICKVPTIKHLYLGSTSITDRSLPLLKNLPILQTLNLCNVPITSDGLKELAEMTTIEALDLRGTKITDEGLPFLKNSNHI